MNIENIDKVIGIMKRIPKENFDLNMFQSTLESYKFTEEEVLSCGSKCCISGWIRVSPEFRDLQNKFKLKTVAFIIEGCNLAVESFATLLDISYELGLSMIYGSDVIYGKVRVTPRDVIGVLEKIKIGELV